MLRSSILVISLESDDQQMTKKPHFQKAALNNSWRLSSKNLKMCEISSNFRQTTNIPFLFWKNHIVFLPKPIRNQMSTILVNHNK